MPARTSPPDVPPEVATPSDGGGGAERRGPFRPARLVTLRDRQSGRNAAHGFRLADVLALAVVAIVALDAAAPGSLLDLPVARALPVVLAALTTGRLLRSFGMYRFGRRERAVVHVVGVVGAVAAGAVVGVVTAWVVPQDVPLRDVLVAWALPTLAVLVALHALWWTVVRRWRSQGRLTPNIVIVGATSHAEQIVADALAERDVNVLGIFDDRLARSPRDVAGVPVLGDVAALVSHRMTPAVDLIVIAVDPTAQRRVQEVMSRLAVLPNDVALVVDDDGAERHAAIRRLADAPLSPLDVVADPGRRAFAKRVQDLALSGVALVLLSPVIALIALAVRLDSPGPVVLPPAPARLQQRGDRRVEVPHDAPRDDGPPRRAPGDRRRRSGHAGRADPAHDQPRRAAAAAQRVQRHDVARRPAAPRHRHEDGRGGVVRPSSPSTPSATGSSPA